MNENDSKMIVHDISHHVQQTAQQFQYVAYELQRPCVIFKPTLKIDGDKWCALYGENLQDGVAGFGNSPREAMSDFDKNWNTCLGEHK
jgi:hypothetical protein